MGVLNNKNVKGLLKEGPAQTDQLQVIQFTTATEH